MEHQATYGRPRNCYEIQTVQWNTKWLLRNMKKLFKEFQEALLEYLGTVMEYHEVLFEYQVAFLGSFIE